MPCVWVALRPDCQEAVPLRTRHTTVLVASGLTGQLARSRIDLRCGCRRKKRKEEDLHEVSTPDLVRRTDLVWTVRSCALWLIFLSIWSHDLGRNIQRETSRVAPVSRPLYSMGYGDTTTRVSRFLAAWFLKLYTSKHFRARHNTCVTMRPPRPPHNRLPNHCVCR